MNNDFPCKGPQEHVKIGQVGHEVASYTQDAKMWHYRKEIVQDVHSLGEETNREARS